MLPLAFLAGLALILVGDRFEVVDDACAGHEAHDLLAGRATVNRAYATELGSYRAGYVGW